MLCPYCNHEHKPQLINVNGHQIPQVTLMGAIPFTTYFLLGLMQREWERPLNESDRVNVGGTNVPQQLAIVLLFWTLFENLMQVFFDAALKQLPPRVSKDLLNRYSAIGKRLDQLYKICFSVTFKEDLISTGYRHISEHLVLLQKSRNVFIHGNPKAIDEKLINDTVGYLQETQEAWIELFNKRCRRHL